MNPTNSTRMNPTHRRNPLWAGVLLAGALLWGTAASADVITWSGPTTITNEDDLQLNDGVVAAFNMTDGPLVALGPTTVTNTGGDEFVFTHVGAGGGSAGGISVSFVPGTQVVDFYGATRFNPPGAIDAGFDDVMDSFVNDNTTGPGSLTTTLSGLQVGNLYGIQVLFSDDVVGTRTIVLDGNPAVTRGDSPYYTGTFTADATGSQAFTVTGDISAILNGVVLTSVVIPEPSTLVLLGCGSLLLAAFRRRIMA